jgi:hypothetical protein
VKGLENLDIGPEGRNTTSHAQRHLNVALSKEFVMPQFYNLDIPVHEKRESIRKPASISLRLPHECMTDDHTADTAAMQSFLDENPHFREHTVFKAALQDGRSVSEVLPCSLYWDGVRYTKNDAFIGFYCENLLSKRKYLICAVRPSLRTSLPPTIPHQSLYITSDATLTGDIIGWVWNYYLR